MINVDKIKARLYTCPICGAVCSTPQEVAKCAANCAKRMEEKENAENLKVMNEAIEEIKRITQVRQDMLDDFKKKYPDAYEKNFGSSENKTDNKTDNKTRVYMDKDTKETVNEDETGVKEFIDFLNFLAGR